jgi:hypothetical protein
MVAEFTRVTDVAFEAVQVTVLHSRRIVGVVSSALRRVTQEVEDLVWDYRDVAGDLRRSARTGEQLPEVAPIDLRGTKNL